jgi:outer membrane protein assembly factor BamB
MPGPALIPTFVIIGPLTFLALALPALFGGLALFVKRWAVLLGVAGLASTLYLLHSWFHGYLQGGWWGTPQALWGTVALTALAGAGWSWKRHWDSARKYPAAGAVPAAEPVSLALASLTGLALGAASMLGTPLPGSLGLEGVAVAAVAGVGTLYAVGLRRAAARGRASPALPTPEAVVLGGVFIACAAWGAIPPAPQPEAAAVQVVWTFEAVPRGAVVSTPAVESDRVYVAAIQNRGASNSGAVYALDRETGRPVWQFDAAGSMQQTASTPCVAGGRLYVGEGMHANRVCKFYCLDVASGRRRWDFSTASHIESSPSVAGGRVYFGAGDDGAVCLDAATGARCWRFRPGLHVDASPALAGGRLYCGSGVSRVHRATCVFCLDGRDGRVLWREPTDLPAWGPSVVDGGEAFFGLGNGRLDRSAEPPEQPAGALLCVEAASGKERWRFATGDAVFGRPCVDPGHVYFGARDGFCYCLDRDGRLCWKEDMGSPVATGPALAGDRLYVVASRGRVACLDAGTGRARWSFDVAAHSRTAAQLYSSPVVVAEQAGEHRRVYFGAELSNAVSSAAVVYCLRD